MFDQILTRGRVGFERPGGRDVVRGHAVAHDQQRPCAGDVLDGIGLGRHVLEIGRVLDIGGPGIPFEGLAFRDPDVLPFLRPFEDIAVAAAEHLRRQRRADDGRAVGAPAPGGQPPREIHGI